MIGFDLGVDCEVSSHVYSLQPRVALAAGIANRQRST
jgi:hypothetical protein